MPNINKRAAISKIVLLIKPESIYEANGRHSRALFPNFRTLFKAFDKNANAFYKSTKLGNIVDDLSAAFSFLFFDVLRFVFEILFRVSHA